MSKTAYLIEKFHEGSGGWCSKYDSLNEAMKSLCLLLLGMTSPDAECDCDDETREKVRGLIHEDKYREAIRAWNNGASETKFAIHRIAVLQEDCQDEEATGY